MAIADLKKLREEEEELIGQIKAARDKPDEEWTTEDRSAFETMADRYEAVLAEIESTEKDAERLARFDKYLEEADERRAQQQAELERRNRMTVPAQTDAELRDIALAGWIRHHMGEPLTEEQRDAAQRVGLNPSSRNLRFTLYRGDYLDVRSLYNAVLQARQQGTAPDTAGGYTVPETMVRELEIALLDFSGVRRVATVRRTAAGEPMPQPTVNDSTNEGRILAENTQVTQTDLVFGQVMFGAHKFSSDLVLMSVELIEDNAVNLVAQLGRLLGERIGRHQNRKYTVGTGTDEPQGITEAPIGLTTASLSAITGDEIIDLIHSVDPAYREGGGASFQLHDTTLSAVRKLKTQDGQYLWQPGMVQGAPPMLWGYPYQVNNHMPVIGASAKIMVFGQMSKYVIRDAASFRLRRLVERYADFDQEGFVAFHRSDGKILDAGTGPFKVMDMPAT